MKTDWKVGEDGFYVLPKDVRANRPRTLYARMRVEKVTAKRIVVRLVKWPRKGRATLPSMLVREAPEGVWVE